MIHPFWGSNRFQKVNTEEAIHGIIFNLQTWIALLILSTISLHKGGIEVRVETVLIL